MKSTIRCTVLSTLIIILSLTATLTTGCGRKNVLAPETSADPPGAPARDAGDDALCARHMQGPAIHLEGTTPAGAMWVIDKPAHWNGSLIAYMHGYVHPQLPLSLPAIDALRDSLLGRGFALAASSYSSNGFAVPEGVRETHQLSALFALRVCRPRHTYLLGQSLGGLIGMLLAEQHPECYDGALLVCGIVGSSTEEIQYLGDVRVLFDTQYPGVLGGDLEHPPVITDLSAQVVGPAVRAVTANPNGLGVIQRLARHPLAGRTSAEMVTSLVNALSFGIVGGADLYQRTHGQSFFDNATYRYASAALPPSVIDDVNQRVARYARTRYAGAYFERYGEPRGPFRIPVMTLYSLHDPVVPAFQEDLLAAAAAGPKLVQNGVDVYGHCTFTAGELASAFHAMTVWAGQRHRALALRFTPREPDRVRLAG